MLMAMLTSLPHDKLDAARFVLTRRAVVISGCAVDVLRLAPEKAVK